MSKMDRMLNSQKEKQSIYEIYRACRLCGAGAGYKMPIIQNVVDLDDTDLELRQKIQECVQIQVHQDDKMPPLICELCVDKVNDFYEFLEMCRQTNKRTRLRLGLPPQSMPRGAPDAGECILGLTEPVYVNEDSDIEPLAKHKKGQSKVKVKNEPEAKPSPPARPPRPSRQPPPPRALRHSRSSRDDSTSLTRPQDKPKPQTKVPPKLVPKSILKKETKTEDVSLLTPRLKRTRDKEPVKLETPVKKVKIAVKASPPGSTPKGSPKLSPRSRPSKAPRASPPPPPRLYKCAVCEIAHKSPQALSNHMRSHGVGYTNLRLACNPCGEWFPVADEAAAHHRQHRNKAKAYTCRRCTANFRHLTSYDDHLRKNQCIPWEEVPDVKCDVCWHLYATSKLLDNHKCGGEDQRPGGKCGKCNKNYALLKNLKKHESNCTAKKKGTVSIDPALLGQLRPLQIRVSRCDPLLLNMKHEHYDVSSVTADFGLDKNCVYPYISTNLRIKSEPGGLDGMVAINEEIKEEFLAEDYVHWDSEESDSDDDVSCTLIENPYKTKRVDSLATLTLKTIFSQRCLGKVPRKKRRVKQEKSMFDSLLNETEDDVTRDINNIISNLGDDIDGKGDERKNYDGKSVFGDESQNDDSNKVGDESKNDDDMSIVGDENKNDDSSKNLDKDTNINDGHSNTLNNNKSSNDDENSKDIVDENKNDDNVKNLGDGESKNNDDEKNDVSMIETNDSANDISKTNLSINTVSEVKLDENRDLCHISNNIDKEIEENNYVRVGDVSYNDDKHINGAVNDKSDDKITRNDDTGSNDDVNSHNKDDLTVTVNNGSNNNKVTEDVNIKHGITVDDNSNSTVIGSKVADCNDETEKNDDFDKDSTKNDLDNSQDSSIGTFNESILNDSMSNDENDEINKLIHKDSNEKCINDNALSVLEENITDTAEKTPKSQKKQEIIDNFGEDSKETDNTQLLDSKLSINEHSDKLNGTKSVIVGLRSTTNEDFDDSDILATLDAQINASDVTNVASKDNVENYDKIALEDLISEKNTDLDIIPDEFNFDS